MVEKQDLLDEKHQQLNADRFFGSVDFTNSNYPMVRLGDLCSFLNGHAFKPEDWKGPESGGLPIVRIQNLNTPESSFNYFTGEAAEKNLIDHGELLFSWAGSKGTSFGAHIWRGQKAVLNQHIFKIQFDDQRITKAYLHIALNRSVTKVEENLHGGVGLVHITKGKLEDIEIPLPSLEEQHRIVSEIEGYQKVLDGVRQILATYQPRVEVSSKWPMVEAGELAQFKNGVNYTKENAGTGIKVLGVRHFQNHVVAPLNDLDEINPDGVLSDGHLLEDGDLIFVRSNGNKELVGRCLIVQPNSLRLTHSAFTIRMRLDRTRCEPKFYAFLLRLPEYRTQMFGSGANINNLSQDILKAIEIPLPPLAEQQHIVADLDDEGAQIEAVRGLIARFDAKIQRVLDRVWSSGGAE